MKRSHQVRLPLDGYASRAGDRVAGLDAYSYTLESILIPGAYIVPGYANTMPGYEGYITQGELDELIAFLLRLTD